MELFHTSTAASPSVSSSLHSSTGVFLDFFEQEANLSSLDLLAASVETTLAFKAENSTFASASTNAPGQSPAIFRKDFLLLNIFLAAIVSLALNLVSRWVNHLYSVGLSLRHRQSQDTDSVFRPYLKSWIVKRCDYLGHLMGIST